MVSDTTRCRALRRAAELVGGIDALGKELQVPAEDLASWLRGDKLPPTFVFLKVVDLLIAHGEDGDALPRTGQG
jgi:hypothetical protein